ncbi:MAG TPA: GNAT family protein [Candidatus Kapabacteria bacterium]|nr:GNAT family protein [Candidatus Kapabacteria bacterium]
MSPLKRKNTFICKGKRVALRYPHPGDGKEFTALNRASKDFYDCWVSPPVTQKQFKQYLERCAQTTVEGLLVCKADDGAIMGAINLSQIFHGNFGNAYMGYYIGAQYAGQGYMTEAMGLAIDHAFNKIKLHRLEANIQPGNKDSIALVKRLSFTRDGYSRRYLKIAGKWRDHERWAITAEDRRAQKKRSRNK